MLRVLNVIQVILALALCSVCRFASAQTANTWRDSTDYLAPATPTSRATGVNEEPQSPAPATPSVKPHRTWYGGQLLLSDALSVSLLATGLGLLSADGQSKELAPGFIWSGALSYVLAPAAVHVVHQRPAIAFASASLRASVPVLGAFMGAMAECPYSVDGEEAPCEGGPAPYLGLSAGILFVSLIDAGLFAYDRPKAESSKLRQFGIAPYISQDGKRGELRAFGTF